MRFEVIDEAGDIVSTFDDLKDAELYIAENEGHKLEIVEVESCPNVHNLFLDHSNLTNK